MKRQKRGLKVEKFPEPVQAMIVDEWPYEPELVTLIGRRELVEGNWRLESWGIGVADVVRLLVVNDVFEHDEEKFAELERLHQEYLSLQERWKNLRDTLTPIPLAPEEDAGNAR